MILIYYVTGIVFLLLGLFLILGGLRRGVDRERLAYSGIGSIIVGIGNISLPRFTLLGLIAIAVGILLVIQGTKIRSDSQS